MYTLPRCIHTILTHISSIVYNNKCISLTHINSMYIMNSMFHTLNHIEHLLRTVLDLIATCIVR